MINSVNNDLTFKGVKFYLIGSRTKERKFLEEAAKGVLKEPLDALEKQGISLDLVRNYSHESTPTKSISIFMSHKPDYFTKDGLNPMQNVVSKVESLEDAQKLISKGIAKSIEFMQEHFKYVKKAKRLGIE